MNLPPIKFAALADALLSRIGTLVDQWLPGGKIKGTEYFVTSLWRNEKTPSLSVCIKGANAGRWGDHGGSHRGGDLLSLYAAIHDLQQGQAALQLARELGLEDVAGVQRAHGDARPAPVAPVIVKEPPKPARETGEKWTNLQPVPAFAPPTKFWHYEYNDDKRPKLVVDHVAEYRLGEALYGYVVRFLKTDGGKEPLPHVFCESSQDGSCAWRWKQFAEPRPLYLPLGELVPGRTVIVVEGEKKADALQNVLNAGAPGIYTVAAWPGGGKTWSKADWAWLAGSAVLLWPDCDGKREPLTKAEMAATPDKLARLVIQQAKPLLPAAKQVGMVTMLGIGAHLRDAHGCTVQMLSIPEPGTVADGWDCGDAINIDGWDFARLQAFFATAHALMPTDADKPGTRGSGERAGQSDVHVPDAGDSGDGGGRKNFDGLAEAGDGDDEFRELLDFMAAQAGSKVGALGVTRKLLISALRKAPLLRDCLGFNELVGAPVTQIAFPWRSLAGPIADSDDLRFGDWVSQHYGIKAASRAALAEAMDTVADGRHFHPVRDWLKAQKHDGTPRLDKWLIHVLGMHPDELPPKRRKYLELVGRFLLMGLVARVMEPGCKFDYSPVFEGPGGIGKSTFVKVLVGKEYFSDTHFDIGNGKDGFEQLEGLWGYELSELTALRKADSEQVKQFFSSEVDRFRGAYGRFVQKHPRQCIIFCSTNKKRYLYDLTGNRRFWPIWVVNRVRLGWLSKFREQLFAEALAAYQAGEPYAPTPEQELEFFVPEQEKRLVETAVQSRLYELLTREGVPPSEGSVNKAYTCLSTFVTLDGLVHALGADAAKSSSLLESQVRGWLEAQGWEYGRESKDQRRRGYKQPAVWPPKIEDEEPDAISGTGLPPTQAAEHEGDDDEPF